LDVHPSGFVDVDVLERATGADQLVDERVYR